MMSDIKYILAGGDDDGQHTRFGCLAMVRYAVTAMVTVLTITVIALSIHAVLRSEDIGISINRGYIGADTLWNQKVVATIGSVTDVGLTLQTSPVAGNHPSSLSKVAEPGTAATETASSSESDLGSIAQVNIGSRPLPKDCFLGCSGPSGGRHRDQQVTFTKPDRTNLRVILVASNPGGRTKIDCNDTRVRLIDMEPPKGPIGYVTLGNFTVLPQTTIKLVTRLSNTNTSYIWENYYLASRFSVKVEVTSSVTSYPLGKRGKTVQQTYVCQPVTIGLMANEDVYASDDHVQCL